MIPPPSPIKPIVVWWALWAAFLMGVCQIFYFLGIAGPAKAVHGPTDPLMAALGLLPVAASIVVRWAILPRISDPRQALPVFIAGIALAEASCFLGLYLFPAYKEALFAFSFLGIAQFIPLFARRYFPS